MLVRIILMAAVTFAASNGTAAGSPGLSGDLQLWHPITLTLTGPVSSETDDPNPFTDYRITVVFAHSDGQKVVVPGYFAADGNAAESGAQAGNVWRAHFTPHLTGTWSYEASLRRGEDVALSSEADAGEPVALNGATGQFDVARPGPTSPRPPSKGEKERVPAAVSKWGEESHPRGLLQHDGTRYLKYMGTGEYYLKGGADSPENFLAYYEFDGTKPSHRYEPHAQDWRAGDPTWRDGRGKNIIGALNYLASKGMNDVYFLTMNVEGDGHDVWPWTADTERFRFDCSKLDQWNIVFSHMDRLGIVLHVLTQETENDQLLDGGDLGGERKLYYRELIARFAHHPALIWNLGEENTNTTEQRRAFAKYIHDLDPYDHPIVVHTFPGQYEDVYRPLLGGNTLEGLSLQMGDMTRTHAETVKWVRESLRTARPWAVFLDEIGPAEIGVKPDADDPDHRDVRVHALWGNLMGGGAGAEWYLGYEYPNNDLNCEDWRSRDRMWDLTRYALDFFHAHLPFWAMAPADELVLNGNAWCLAQAGAVYALYLPEGGQIKLQADGTYHLSWFNPRTGGGLVDAGKTTANDGAIAIGPPPDEPNQDWAVLIKRLPE